MTVDGHALTLGNLKLLEDEGARQHEGREFGIAKLADRDEPAAAGSFSDVPADIALTQSGTALGTPSYMAPEQRSSPSTVDQRADIYAFGLILYDMLVGRHRAQHSNSAIEELQARMQAAPPPVKSILPEVPDALDQIIARCLERSRTILA